MIVCMRSVRLNWSRPRRTVNRSLPSVKRCCSFRSRHRVESPKNKGHQQQANGIEDNTCPGEYTDTGVHRVAHQSIVDNLLLVYALFELGEMLAELINFVHWNWVIVYLSFHNFMFLVG